MLNLFLFNLLRYRKHFVSTTASFWRHDWLHDCHQTRHQLYTEPSTCIASNGQNCLGSRQKFARAALLAPPVSVRQILAYRTQSHLCPKENCVKCSAPQSHNVHWMKWMKVRRDFVSLLKDDIGSSKTAAVSNLIALQSINQSTKQIINMRYITVRLA